MDADLDLLLTAVCVTADDRDMPGARVPAHRGHHHHAAPVWRQSHLGRLQVVAHAQLAAGGPQRYAQAQLTSSAARPPPAFTPTS
jgi:hypothetical protein